MKIVSYGIFGEDEAHKIFIKNYITQKNLKIFEFILCESFQQNIKERKYAGKKDVINKAKIVAQAAFSQYYTQPRVVFGIETDFKLCLNPAGKRKPPSARFAVI